MELRLSFNPDETLRLVEEFHVVVQSNGRQMVTAPGGLPAGGLETLWALNAFRVPRTPRSVAAEAAANAPSPEAWVSKMDSVISLYRAGILLESDQSGVRASEHGFASESQHIVMLNDHRRTRAFIEAIRATIRPNDVVLDIGTGTGVLAMAAAKAGAQHVYAIEESDMADVAEAGIRNNGLSDRITVLRGRSTSLTLPERADLVVAEIIGDDPFDESILPSLADACRRHAKPGAAFIPESLTLAVQPLDMPRKLRAQVMFTPDVCAEWSELYELDFTCLLDAARRPTAVRQERPCEYLQPLVQGSPVFLPAVAFPNDQRAYSAQVAWPGRADTRAFALGFLATLADGIELTNIPGRQPEGNHWGSVLWAPVPGHGPDLSQPGALRVSWSGGATQIELEKSEGEPR